MIQAESKVILDFPLHGDWVATSTPAQRVPSHGTDAYGQRYAFDFVRFDSKWDLPYAPSSFWAHLLWTIPASAFLCWDEPVLSAFEGTVVGATDGCADHEYVNLAWEFIRGTFLPPLQRPGDFRSLAGNFVLVEGAEGVAFHAHLRRGSVCVQQGQRILAGQRIGRVGNSGNPTMPHLHFHLMNGVDLAVAAGVPCAFRHYERRKDGEWEAIDCGVPGLLERIRSSA